MLCFLGEGERGVRRGVVSNVLLVKKGYGKLFIPLKGFLSHGRIR